MFAPQPISSPLASSAIHHFQSTEVNCTPPPLSISQSVKIQLFTRCFLMTHLDSEFMFLQHRVAKFSRGFLFTKGGLRGDHGGGGGGRGSVDRQRQEGRGPVKLKSHDNEKQM